MFQILWCDTLLRACAEAKHQVGSRIRSEEYHGEPFRPRKISYARGRLGERMLSAQTSRGLDSDTVVSLLGCLSEHGSAIHFPERGTLLEYREIPDLAYGVAHDLAAKGVGRGDVVGVLAPACPGFISAFFGAVSAGAAASVLPIPTLGADLGARLAPILAATGVRCVVTAGAFNRFAPDLSAVWGIDVLCAEDCAPRTRLTTETISDGDVAMMPFTSGSISTPKGVLLTHAAICDAQRDVSTTCELSTADVFCSWLPLSHDFGINTVLTALFNDAPLHQFNPPSFIRDTAGFLRYMAEVGATIVPGPNFAIERLIATVRDWDGPDIDLSRWRMAWDGGEVINPDTVEDFPATLGRFGVSDSVLSPAYGMAEFAGPICGVPMSSPPLVLAVDRRSPTDGAAVVFSDPDNPETRRIVSSGPVFGRCEVRVVGPEGEPLEAGFFGSIQARGVSQMLDYRQPTDEQVVDVYGWLTTGDTGFLHEEQLFIAGRRKDVAIVAGRNFHAEDVEMIATAVAGVYKNHAAAVADPLREQIVVFAEVGDDIDDAEQIIVAGRLRARVAEHLGFTALDIRLLRKGQLPRTTSGKWQRQKLRDQLSTEDHDGD